MRVLFKFLKISEKSSGQIAVVVEKWSIDFAGASPTEDILPAFSLLHESLKNHAPLCTF